MKVSQTGEKIGALHQLLSQDSTTLEKFQSVVKLASGINPNIDQALDKAADALGKIENLSKGEIIELSVDALPEDDEKQKKRKKAIVLFIKYYKELKSEVERVQAKFEENSGQDSKSVNQQISTASRIASFAKGPFGIITIAAVIIVAVGGMFLSQKSPSKTTSQASLSALPSQSPSSPTPTPTPSPTQKTRGIIFDGQKVPLSEIKSATGPECDREPHYHALDNTSAKTFDGSRVQDPGGCGFGKVEEVQIVEF